MLERVFGGERATMVVSVAAGDGGGSAPSWLFCFYACLRCGCVEGFWAARDASALVAGRPRAAFFGVVDPIKL